LKIAVTADIHLTTRTKHPERFQVLESILNHCVEVGIKLLIIAGDLFDQSFPNYAEFEDLYRTHRPPGLNVVIIPGNHDHKLDSKSIVGDGLRIYDEPILLPLNKTWKILFVPFHKEQTMGAAIAPFLREIINHPWILVGHGDWSAGLTEPNLYEPGVYMPLTTTDLEEFQPELVFLGHIHKPFSDGKVYSPGSPCPVDKSETGLRRSLILDTKTGEIASQVVDTPLLYFKERFIIIPGDDELTRLEFQLKQRIESWNLPAGWENRVKARIELSGISSDRNKTRNLAKSTFSAFHLEPDGEPILDQLYHQPDPDRTYLARQLQEWVDNLDWHPLEGIDPTKSEIMEHGLKIIYGVE
jgi:DNA repair exonuclease SbcCD nuclease subunit